MKFPLPARVLIALVIAAGLSVLGYAAFSANAIYAQRFIAFLLVACLAARLKVKLPGVTGNMSVNLPFILVAAAEMSLIEAMIVGCLSNFVQCLPRKGKKFSLVQAAFNFSTMALAVAATRWIYGYPVLTSLSPSPSLRLAIASAGFFLTNTVLIAIVIAFTEQKNIVRTWLHMFRLAYPYFLASAGVAGVVLTLTSRVGWQVPIGILPLMFGIFYSYRRYFSLPPKPVASVLPGQEGASRGATA